MSVVCEFRWSTVAFLTHADIAILHFLGMAHTALDKYVRTGARFDIVGWLGDYTNSMEMLAYMPAFWIMFQIDQKLLAFEPLSQLVSQRQAIWLLAWMIAFNTYEDGVSTMMSGVQQPHFVAGKLLHFFLVLDFSSLFLQQAYNSKVAKNEVVSSVPLPGVAWSWFSVADHQNGKALLCDVASVKRLLASKVMQYNLTMQGNKVECNSHKSRELSQNRDE